jgi:fructokinase
MEPDGRGDSGVVAVAGEALIDLLPRGDQGLFEAVPGGSPANVAVGLARLGVPTRMLARIADDALGQRLRVHLAGNGVDLSFAVRAPEPTSLAIVTMGPDGLADYDFRVEGTADWQWRDAELAGALDEQVLALHAGSLALTMPPGAAVLADLLARARDGATVSYDPNCRPLLMGSPEQVRDQVDRLVALADVVKASADDLAWLLPGRAAGEVAVEWLARGPAIVAITLGAAGAVAAAARTGTVRRAAPRVEVGRHRRRRRRLHERPARRPARPRPARRPAARGAARDRPGDAGPRARPGGAGGDHHLHPQRRAATHRGRAARRAAGFRERVELSPAVHRVASLSGALPGDGLADARRGPVGSRAGAGAARG